MVRINRVRSHPLSSQGVYEGYKPMTKLGLCFQIFLQVTASLLWAQGAKLGSLTKTKFSELWPTLTAEGHAVAATENFKTSQLWQSCKHSIRVPLARPSTPPRRTVRLSLWHMHRPKWLPSGTWWSGPLLWQRRAFMARLNSSPTGAAAIHDATAVYFAFKGNNPLASVVLSYAQTSHEKLDMQMSYIEKLRAATFADYLCGVGAPLMTLPPKPSSTQKRIVGDKWFFFEGGSLSCRSHTQTFDRDVI